MTSVWICRPLQKVLARLRVVNVAAYLSRLLKCETLSLRQRDKERQALDLSASNAHILKNEI